MGGWGGRERGVMSNVWRQIRYPESGYVEGAQHSN